MLRIESSGSFRETQSWLDKMIEGDVFGPVQAVAQEGVLALQAATPKKDGDTAAAWSYEIVDEDEKFTIWFTNGNEVDGFNVAVGLQYGHGTGNGGWVAGYDYINPALKPIFDRISNKVWEEVRSA